MSEEIHFLIIAAGLMAFALVARLVTRAVLTAPIVMLAAGAGLSYAGAAPLSLQLHHLHLFAEVALVVLLFLDAARTDVRGLLSKHVWPLRAIVLGMPLSFLLGTAAFWVVLPDAQIGLVMLLAALMVPTDAALGKSLVENEALPKRTRRALVVESGLNDGIALPAILICAALAAHAPAEHGGWGLFVASQLLIGPIVGAALGVAMARVMLWAQSQGYTSELYEGIATLALAACAYLAATSVGGNGLIAAFCCGAGFGYVAAGRCSFVYEFLDGDGQLLSWAAFFLIGALLVPEALSALTLPMALAILVSLCLVRPASILAAFTGSDADMRTKLLLGWFGPRGLATALFALILADRLPGDMGQYVVDFAANAVWISAVLHGVSVIPITRAFARAPRSP
ncbi:cation:proton antiporter [Cognatishimia sp. SS12]|uniref:cation:proton antiporter domain-containing protein n=1 Tax=Cognatishimia sp. SS12 TaxID=2979465 RepID=UPI00232E168A|nr:cation:proton antiporter [Cognatishimia sp. SS12]MDC0738472.1 cation:proton antiporter [Cognatishimia sp. SS12]